MTSEKHKKPPLKDDTAFLLWITPIAAYLIAICFDIGYLSYYDIPIVYAELNFYSVSNSVLYVIFIFGFSYIALLGVNALHERKSFIFPMIFEPQCAALALFIFILLMVVGKPAIWALYIYIILNSLRVLALVFDKSSGLPIAERLRIGLYDNEMISPGNESPQKQNSFMDVMGKLTLFLMLLLLLHAAGSSVASRHSWAIKGHENSIVVSRNNNLYIEKKYDPKTMILDTEHTVILLSPTAITLVPNNVKLITKTRYDSMIAEQESNRRTEARIKEFFEYKQ